MRVWALMQNRALVGSGAGRLGSKHVQLLMRVL